MDRTTPLSFRMANNAPLKSAFARGCKNENASRDFVKAIVGGRSDGATADIYDEVRRG